MSSQSDDALLALENTVHRTKGPLVPLLPARQPRLSVPDLPQNHDVTNTTAGGIPGWTCTTFLCPAAFPRSTKNATTSRKRGSDTANRGSNETGNFAKVNPKVALEEMLTKQLRGAAKLVEIDDEDQLEQQEQLFLVVKRYSPNSAPHRSNNQSGLTLVLNHANGFQKEIWEPTMIDLLESLENSAQSLPVVEIWSLDAVCQGDSAVVNEHTLGETFNWSDHGRDILNFLVSYLPEKGENLAGTRHLPRTRLPSPNPLLLDTIPQPIGPAIPCARIFKKHLLVGIGHSLGGGGLAFAASTLPSIFAASIYIDPVITSPEANRSVRTMTTGALVRRERWQTKQEAKQGFLKKAFFRSWDSRVFENYIQYGLRQVGGEVVLKTKAKYEALVFCDPKAASSQRAFERMRLIPNRLPTHFIFADVNRSVLPEPFLKSLVAQVGHSTFTRVAAAGHLVPQEKPKECAREIGKVLQKWFPANDPQKARL